jgi:MOSC domain-containing protein
MSHLPLADAGTVESLWRYPVKSMMGEGLQVSRVLESGLQGDRVYALVDTSDGKVATAKNPRKWPRLFGFRAACIEPFGSAAIVPAVRVTLPDGRVVTGQQPDINEVLSKALDREVTLGAIGPTPLAPTPASAPASSTKAEEYWPDIEGLDYQDTVTDFELPRGTFFDCATIHVLAITTLERLKIFYPQGRFEIARFRPNIVLKPAGGVDTFVEDAWVGRTMAIGDEVRLKITGPCGRCVMTTLAQGDLPNDRGILRTAVQHHRANVGAYAAVLRGGTVRRGDRVTLESD